MNITEQDYELLSQYLDRELSPPALTQLELRLAEEPELQTGLASLQSLQSRLQNAFHGITRDDVPERITALLQPAPAAIVPLPHRRIAGWRFALAASLVVAASATLVSQWGQFAGRTLGASGTDTLLAHALEGLPSHATDWETLADGRSFRPVLSFRSLAGDWCREYLLADGSGNWHAVACRGENGWANTVFTRTDLAGSSDDYRPAEATDSDEVADFINQNAAAIPLDSSTEADLIARQWR